MQTQSLLLTAPNHLEWISEKLPPPQPDEVLVRTTAGAISIGAELPQFRGIARGRKSAHYPRMTGYESVGKIVACGEAVERLHIGDRVVAFYGHRTHALVREAKAIIVPGEIPDSIALLVILTCDVTRGIRKLTPMMEHSILVTGAGTMGLLTVFMLKALGLHAIDIVEPRIERHELALQLGARRVATPQQASSRIDTYSIGFECSGSNAAFALLQHKMKREGRICILSDGNLEPLILTPDFHEKELSIVGSSDGWDYQQHAQWYFQTLREHSDYSLHLERIFDYHTTKDDLISTFKGLAKLTMIHTKVLVHYDIAGPTTKGV